MEASPALRFLMVDYNADSRGLLVQALRQRFPQAVFHEAGDGDSAMRIVRTESLAAIISHRTYDYDGETLVALFRRMSREVPIIMVSGYDRTARAMAAGADAFLNYDKWLRIASVVSQVMALRHQKRAAANAGGAAMPAEAAMEAI